MKKLIAYLIAIAVIIYAGKTLFSAINSGGNSKRNTEISIKDNSVDTENTEEEKPKKPLFTASENDATVGLGEEIDSDYVILIDEQEGTIIAEKNAHSRMVPASMTKVLTVLVAAEQIEEEDLDDVVTITFEATDYAYVNDCSVTGF